MQWQTGGEKSEHYQWSGGQEQPTKKFIKGLQGLFLSQDLISNSPYCLPYNTYDLSLENLVLDQLRIGTFF